ncbi:MAG: DUF4432 family protein [Acetobacteraceae bacterium]|nr:DUF4432 family protein [Acetobacteraceae bacterium]
MNTVTVPLDPANFGASERVLLETAGLVATGFRYPTGIAAVRLANARGHVVVLPWMGQIVWDAVFDGVRLTMASLFDMPRPAAGIIDTYGCLAFHSGLLRNGCPGPEDTHALHGEFACATMDSAQLALQHGDAGPVLRVESRRTYAQGFGSRYQADPHVALAAGSTMLEIGLAVENTGGRAMDLMYMCHINPAFAAGARIVQPAPYTPHTVAVRTAVPAHVPSSPDYLATIARLAADPALGERLDGAVSYDPEQVFYLHDLDHDAGGMTKLMLLRAQGDGIAIAFSVHEFPHVVRWLMHNEDHRVAAVALPSTCEPEGFLAERRKGNVVLLQPGEARRFSVQVGYVDSEAAKIWERDIAALSSRPETRPD